MLRYIFMFTSLFIFLSCADDNDQSDPISDKADRCEYYRTIARFPNPLSHVGTVCCEVGCFSNVKGTPWEHVSQVPECVDEINPTFYLFTPENDSSIQFFDYYSLNATVDHLIMTPSRQFFVIVHGFNTHWPDDWMTNSSWSKNWIFPMKDELIKLGHNVMLVKWTGGSNHKDYIKAAANTRVVGKTLSIVMSTLVKHKSLDLSTSTIVGFSLGAHTSGYAGRELPGLKRIIGLDPAGPLFVCENVEARLDPNDAKFVQIIHTNGEPFLSGGLGTVESLGHIDFYANGGQVQTGCESTIHLSAFAYDFAKVGSKLSCSHQRAVWLFTETLKRSKHSSQDCSFASFPCDSVEKWQRGECFKCSGAGCPSPGIGLDVGSVYKGKYFFSTVDANVTDGFCSRQVLVSIAASSAMKGSIYVAFRNSENGEVTDLMKFQKGDESFKSGQLKSLVMAVPWNYKTVSKVVVSYRKYHSKLFKDGPPVFKLNTISVTDLNGSSMQNCSPENIDSDKPVEVNLVSKC